MFSTQEEMKASLLVQPHCPLGAWHKAMGNLGINPGRREEFSSGRTFTVHYQQADKNADDLTISVLTLSPFLKTC